MKKTKSVYMNIQGLLPLKNKQKKTFSRRKLDYLSDYVLRENVKIIFLTETHLDPDISDEEVQIPNFKIYRSDRKQRKCGGAAIYVHEELNVSNTEFPVYSNGTCESVIIYIEEIKLHAVCIYRPPDTTSEKFNPCLTEINRYLVTVPATENIIFAGDLNFPYIDWNEEDDSVIYQKRSGGTKDEQSQFDSLINITDNHLLLQTITEPTRNNNVLDLVFTNNSEMVANPKVHPVPKSLSDHNLINTEIPIKEKFKENSKPREKLHVFNYWSQKANWKGMNEHLSNHKWEFNAENKYDVKANINELYVELHKASEKYIPMKKATKYKSIPTERRRIFRRSKFLKRKIMNCKDKNRDKIIHELMKIEEKLIQSYDNDRLRNEKTIVNGVKKNTKLFFKYAQRSRKTKDTIGPLKDSQGKLFSDPQNMCEILKTQFEKSFNKAKNDVEVVLDNPKENEISIDELFSDPNACFTQINITDEDVVSAIKSTKINSAAGPDSIPPIVLHNCAESLTTPLKNIFQKSLENCDIPKSWKEAFITPIFKKKGNKNDPSMYRPVSLTSQLVKLLERIVRIYMVQFIELNSILPDSQHGFRPSRSANSQLLEQNENIIDALDNHCNLDIVMLDYAKAFDKINISKLLFKLKSIGIGGKIGKWLGNFLLNRTQRITNDGYLSSESAVLSGVPQGTILGPILFLIFISDIGDTLTTSKMSSYADDSKVYAKIQSPEDSKNLQLDLNRIYTWTEKNLMLFNSDKFEVLKVGKNQNLKNEIYKNPDNKDIPEISVAKDIGVYFNTKGDFSDHIKIKFNKAKQMAGYILRSFILRTPAPMMLLFKSLVIPHLEYCCILWNPHLQKDIAKLEIVQRYFTSKLDGMENLTYYERLKKLKIYSLERRRDRYVLIYVFKILMKKVPNPGISFKYSTRRGRVLTSPASNSKTTDLIHHSFTRRAPRIFNAIPQSLRDLPLNTSLDSIKNRLDKFLGLIPDEPRLPGCFPTTASASNRIEDQLLLVQECLREEHR